MHELSIAIQIMDIVDRHLPKNEKVLLKKISLKVGKLSAVVPESLSYCIEAITKDSSYAQGVELEIIEIPVQVECRDCKQVSQVDPCSIKCMDCDSRRIDIISGWEFSVESIEVE